MTADLIRDFYEYHFEANRKIWDRCIVPLTDEQFVQEHDYSIGSVRNQVVHMMSVDERWFSGLRGVSHEDLPDFLNPADYPTREKVRAKWDAVEAMMRDYLETITEEELTRSLDDVDAFSRGKTLLHVVNHGTDHRAQLLVLLNRLGVKTFPQDYFFYLVNDL